MDMGGHRSCMCGHGCILKRKCRALLSNDGMESLLCALMPWLLDDAQTGQIAPLETSLTCECQIPVRTLDICTTIVIYDNTYIRSYTLAWSYYEIATSHVTVIYIPVITANSNVDKNK